VDPVAVPIPVRPVVHYCMGGVHTDNDGRTPLAGLYAAGECACVSINGSNRLGSNSLVELLVFGARAGRHAAAYVRDARLPSEASVGAQLDDERRRLAALENGTGERIATLRSELQATMERGAGIYRDRAGLGAAVEQVAALRARYANVRVEDRSRTFNTEIVSALELGFLLDCAEATVHAALAREESRGSHQRRDFPARDDERFLAHSLVHAGPRVERLPVRITRWPPGERVYGREEKT
jgi:fumarate reductase flavoprotein subunit